MAIFKTQEEKLLEKERKKARKELLNSMSKEEKTAYIQNEFAKKKEQIQYEQDKKDFSKPITEKIKYYGGSTKINKECNVTITISDKQIILNSILHGSTIISLSEITDCFLDTEKEVFRRFTVTRIALFGPFALAMKKKKTSKKQYIVIQTHNDLFTLDGDGYINKKIYSCIKYHLKNLDVIYDDNPYEELKKLKELLDMGVISPEEFEQKKEKLLNLL